jgi:hypothetical protein
VTCGGASVLCRIGWTGPLATRCEWGNGPPMTLREVSEFFATCCLMGSHFSDLET